MIPIIAIHVVLPFVVFAWLSVVFFVVLIFLVVQSEIVDELIKLVMPWTPRRISSQRCRQNPLLFVFRIRFVLKNKIFQLFQFVCLFADSQFIAANVFVELANGLFLFGSEVVVS